ncbi:hypothetical protein SAMN05216439_0479 [Methanobrevibacter gottschalkii]|uniref:Uncharacterized protein n=2 Tax=Methanobrevibacter gottschalkii TaxID=190974 RepID=A0A3N5B4A2_9EURY|nr:MULTISPECIES: UPF0280 family protein [Methanobrevibacter]MCQ2970238.1 UPF0280 family protein [archaeon]OEC98714.1 hypothetical protein A9505_04310 [Methanobrevibacter sp. A27]RPF51949.1 hypothetical protein EDC42_1292 [Methanobrevibacter gottschalkii DSM 11977]SEL40681.1 hypothetical protein SAMN05216439_0479 [Methanobrevibacter gottschalkii]
MDISEINLDETHIRLTTDLSCHDLKRYIFSIRRDLKNYIFKNQEFALSLEPIKSEDNLPLIVKTMIDASNIADVGPMACVAGAISQLSLNYLIEQDSKYSIVENGGDIALINDSSLLCGIYSNNQVLGNDIAFKIKPRKKPLGICTSSGKIGHSISFGKSDSVTVISKSSAISDGIATRVANEVNGSNSEEKVSKGLECGEDYSEFFDGLLIISENNVGTVGRLPKIIETKEFDVKIV